MQLEQAVLDEVKDRIRSFHEARRFERDTATLIRAPGWITLEFFNYKDRYEMEIVFRSNFRYEKCAVSHFRTSWSWNCALEKVIEDHMFKFFQHSVLRFDKILQRDNFIMKKKHFSSAGFGLHECEDLILYVNYELKDGKLTRSMEGNEGRITLFENHHGKLESGIRQLVKMSSMDTYMKLDASLRDLI